ncbi:hypothetical protein L6452_32098 [Arctium lappa]|uniref:Uncharacterized protein n=1 Tax=Arctium lappa TaxID=4217 RepID=A0ACB8Z3P2_ARCLA|nr:hypothetical protein L6452_32098 [Arctium lappa]
MAIRKIRSLDPPYQEDQKPCSSILGRSEVVASVCPSHVMMLWTVAVVGASIGGDGLLPIRYPHPTPTVTKLIFVKISNHAENPSSGSWIIGKLENRPLQ